MEGDQFFTAINTLVRHKGGAGVTDMDDDEVQATDLDTGTMVIMDDLDDDDDSGTMKRG